MVIGKRIHFALENSRMLTLVGHRLRMVTNSESHRNQELERHWYQGYPLLISMFPRLQRENINQKLLCRKHANNLKLHKCYEVEFYNKNTFGKKKQNMKRYWEQITNTEGFRSQTIYPLPSVLAGDWFQSSSWTPESADAQVPQFTLCITRFHILRFDLIQDWQNQWI